MSSVPLLNGYRSGNPGDIYISWGLQYLIGRVLRDPHYLFIDKFSNKDITKYREQIKALGYVIYAGTPQYNRYSDWCMYYDWDVFKQYILPDKIQVYPLAGGGGIPKPGMSPTDFASYCLEDPFTKKVLAVRRKLAGTTTTRDPHAQKLLETMGWKSTLLPCTALWAPKYLDLQPIVDKPIAFVPPNPKMVEPGLLGLETQQEVSQWLLNLYKKLKTIYPDMIVICHGFSEYELFSKYPETIYTNDTYGLLKLYSSIEGVISFRLHGAVPVAGLYKPSVLVGIDTRSSAADVIGIPRININAPNLVDKIVAGMSVKIDQEALLVQENKYLGILRDIFKGRGYEASLFRS